MLRAFSKAAALTLKSSMRMSALRAAIFCWYCVNVGPLNAGGGASGVRAAGFGGMASAGRTVIGMPTGMAVADKIKITS